MLKVRRLSAYLLPINWNKAFSYPNAGVEVPKRPSFEQHFLKIFRLQRNHKLGCLFSCLLSNCKQIFLIRLFSEQLIEQPSSILRMRD